jgi:type II secretory pathway component PulF
VTDGGLGDARTLTSTLTSRWRYQAADAVGTPVAGEIEASSERDAIDALRRRSLWVTALEPARGTSAAAMKSSATDPEQRAWGATMLRRSIRSSNAGIAPQELAAITRAIATLLSAGVPLDRALAYAASQGSNDGAKAMFASVRDAVRNGTSFSAAIARHAQFPAYFAPTLSAGEASGTLPAALQLLAEHLERSASVRAKLRSALIYPAILGLASIVGVSVIMVLVVPRFATLIQESGGTLPTSTRLLIALSGVLTRYWWVILGSVVLGSMAWQRVLRDPVQRTRWDAARLRWPVVGSLERTREAAAYTGTLSVALKSGVGLLSAMALARAVVANRQIGNELASAEARVRDGGTLAGALDGVLPPLAVRLLDAGEIGGDLAMLAGRAADSADDEVQQAVSRSVTLVEPVMILGFGGLVGFVALALLQAIYGINARSL